MEADFPEHIPGLFEWWARPAVWRRLRQLHANLGNALAIEEHELLALGLAPGAPLPPTSVGVRMVTRELDALGRDHERLRQFVTERFPQLLGHFPAIPSAALLDEAAAVRCAERVAGVLGEVLTSMRAAAAPVTTPAVEQPDNCNKDEWTVTLLVKETRFVLGAAKNAVSGRLQELKTAGTARTAGPRGWCLKLSALRTDQRERYDRLAARKRTAEEKELADLTGPKGE